MNNIEYNQIENDALEQLSPKERRVNVYVGYAWNGVVSEDEHWESLRDLFSKYKEKFDGRFKEYGITLSVQRLRGTHGEKNFETISEKIASADVLVFDITNKDATGLNPNVMLELGMAIALKKPLFIFVNDKLKEKIPSDLAGYLFTFYSDEENKKLKDRLEDFRGFVNKYIALLNNSANQRIERM